MLRSCRLGVERLERRELLAGDLIGRTLIDQDKVSDFVAHGDEASYFVFDDQIHGSELWTTQGDARSTHLVRDLNTGPASSPISKVLATPEGAVVLIEKGISFEVWHTDGTEQGTRLILSGASNNVSISSVIDSGAFVMIDFAPVFVPLDGAQHVELIPSDQLQSTMLHLATSSDQAIFVEQTFPQSRIWMSDGTAEGTLLVNTESLGFDDESILFVWNGTFLNDSFYAAYTGDESYLIRIDSLGQAERVQGDDVLESHIDFSTVNDKLFFVAGAKLYRLADDATYSVVGWIADGASFTVRDDWIVYNYSVFEGDAFQYYWGYLDLATGESHYLPNSPRLFYTSSAAKFPMAHTGDWLVYQSPDDFGIGLVAYNFQTQTSSTLFRYRETGDVSFIAGVDGRIFYRTMVGTRSRLRLMQLDEERTMYHANLPFASIHTISEDGSHAFFWTEEDGEARYWRLNLLTGQKQKLVSDFGIAPTLFGVPKHNFWNAGDVVHQLDSNQFVFAGDHGTSLFNGSSEPSVTFLDRDQNGRQVRQYSHVSDDVNVVVFDSVSTDNFRRVLAGSDIEWSEDYLLLPGVREINVNAEGLIYLSEGHVWRLSHQDDSIDDATLLVPNYRSLQLQPLTVDEVAQGNVFAGRILSKESVESGSFPNSFDELIYATDGTARRTGLVDSTERIMARFDNVSSVRFSGNDGAFSGRVDIDGERKILVERATATGLQLFFPLDEVHPDGSLYRLEDAWIFHHQGGIEPVTWLWKDSEPAPILVDAETQIYLIKNNALFAESFPTTAGVSKDYVATVEGLATSLRALSDIQGDNFSADIVGETDDGVVIAAATNGLLGEFKLYFWDGTETGLQPLDTLNRLVDENELYDFRTFEIRDNIRVILQDDSALLMHRGNVYQTPLAERTIEITSGSVYVSIENQVLTFLNANDQASPITESDGRVTLDATGNTGTIGIYLQGNDSLPATGLRVKAPANAQIVISPVNTDSHLTYEVSDDLVTVIVGGRKIWIEVDDVVNIIDEGGVPSDSQQASRDIILRSPGSSLSLSTTSSQTRGVVFAKSVVSLQFSRDIDVLRLISAAPDQRFVMPKTPLATQVHVLSAANNSAEWLLETSEDLLMDSVNTDDGGRTIFATRGTAQYQFDVTDSPLHNPLRAVDTDGNNDVTPADILTVINYLANGTGYRVTENVVFPDVSDDGEISPLDILEVINHLAESQSNSPQGEMKSTTDRAPQSVSSSFDLAISSWQDDEDEAAWQQSAEAARLF